MPYELNFEVEPFIRSWNPDHFQYRSGLDREELFSSYSGGLEKEFRFINSCEVKVKWHDHAVPMADDIAGMHNDIGIYVVFHDNQPFYVGKSTRRGSSNGMGGRFRGRNRELVQISGMGLGHLSRCLQKQISVNWTKSVTLGSGCSAFKWDGAGTAAPHRDLDLITLINMLEIFYIWNLSTLGHGNTSTEQPLTPVGSSSAIIIKESRVAMNDRTLTIGDPINLRNPPGPPVHGQRSLVAG